MSSKAACVNLTDTADFQYTHNMYLLDEFCHDYSKRGLCIAIDSAYKSPLISYSFVRSKAQMFYVLLRVRIAPANAPTKISGEILTNIHSNA